MENPLLELQEYENLQEALKKAKGPVQATGTLDSQKVHLMYWLGKDGGFPWKLVVTYDDQRAREIYDDFRSFTENVWLYPAKDLLFYSADIHGNLMTRQRINGIKSHIMSCLLILPCRVSQSCYDIHKYFPFQNTPESARFHPIGGI